MPRMTTSEPPPPNAVRGRHSTRSRWYGVALVTLALALMVLFARWRVRARRMRLALISRVRRAPVRTPDEREATVGGVRTRLLELDGTGPTIVLLHGFGDSADTWRPLMSELAATGRRVVATDLPHFGQADRPQQTSLLEGFDEFTAALVRECDRGDGVVLVGNSLGGLLALRAGEDSSLPLVAVAGLGPAGLGFHPWMSVLDRCWGLLALLARLPMSDERLQRMSARGFKRAGSRTGAVDDVLAQRLASHLTSADRPRIIDTARRTMQEMNDAGETVHPDQFAVPVLLMYGSRDYFCPPGVASRAVAGATGVDLVVFEGAGHVLQLEVPVDVAQKLLVVTDRAMVG